MNNEDTNLLGVWGSQIVSKLGVSLEENTTLDEGTSLSVEAIIELLSTCVNTAYFQVDNKFFQQEFGMAMGFPLSPVLSNIYIEEFERRTMDSYELKPRMWLRYVDDTFVI
ncbi:hypothetical protein Trydic_g10619 [Trypoxylus dichotomus]